MSHSWQIWHTKQTINYLIGADFNDLQVILPSLVCKLMPCHWASQFDDVFKSTWKNALQFLKNKNKTSRLEKKPITRSP